LAVEEVAVSIIDEMQRDQESIHAYHAMEIIDEWCRAGGSLQDLHETLAFWPKCEAIARRRAEVQVLWCHLAEVAEELMDEAKAALRAGRLEELARTWWPEGAPVQRVKVTY
jgi:hypothetical protein